MDKSYIGDGIYIKEGDFVGQFELTTEDGINAQNIIYLETEHIETINQYVKRSMEEKR